METVEITFSELRSIFTSVITFIQQEYWWDKGNDFKTRIESDLGITGDDGAELMKKFSNQFQVDLTIFQFDRYFYPEPTGGNPLLVIVALIMLIVFVLKILLVGLLFLFNKETSQRIWHYSLTKAWNRWADELGGESQDKAIRNLTVADLITSAIQGKFIERQTIRFKLKTGKDLA